jgi:hypothetical protein
MLFLRRKIVKKLFLVLVILLVGMTGLPAAPPGQGWVNDTPQMVMPYADIAASAAVPGPAPMWPDAVFVTAQSNEAAFTQAVELISLWAEQYRQGLLTADEFTTLVAGRIGVLFMRDQVGIEGMKSLAEETRKKVDRLFMYREIELGIQRPISLASAEYPLLC